jgi:NADH dehydrogenase/NADH:ubiquinone oxidoreductase subunit G
MNDITDWDDDIIDQDDTDEEFIELTEIVEDISDSEADESFIELTDIVEDDGDDLNLDIVQEEQDDFIEELDLQIEEEPVVESVESIEAVEEELEEEIDDISIDLEDDPNLYDEEILADEVSSVELSISADQLEAALERVIEKKFADKIESILFEVMEKVIEKEINEIRESLQKDLDQIGDV